MEKGGCIAVSVPVSRFRFDTMTMSAFLDCFPRILVSSSSQRSRKMFRKNSGTNLWMAFHQGPIHSFFLIALFIFSHCNTVFWSYSSLSNFIFSPWGYKLLDAPRSLVCFILCFSNLVSTTVLTDNLAEPLSLYFFPCLFSSFVDHHLFASLQAVPTPSDVLHPPR